jgi:hypothetical protein
VIARHLGHDWTEVSLTADVDPALERHPWDKLPPIVLDLTAATDLGYRPVGDYASTVPADVDWLVNDRPDLDGGFVTGLFDYATEDRYLADRVR